MRCFFFFFPIVFDHTITQYLCALCPRPLPLYGRSSRRPFLFTMPVSSKSVQTFGRKRNAVAVALAREAKKGGLIRLNGAPLHLVEPAIMRIKAIEPILLLGADKFRHVDMRVRVKGGGQSAQIYAIRQAIAKAMVAYAQKCESAPSSSPVARARHVAR